MNAQEAIRQRLQRADVSEAQVVDLQDIVSRHLVAGPPVRASLDSEGKEAAWREAVRAGQAAYDEAETRYRVGVATLVQGVVYDYSLSS